MFNTVNTGFSAIIWGQPVQTPRIAPLSEDERILYNKIGNDVLRLHIEQRKKVLTSENRVIIFRQSKSWGDVQELFTQIHSTDVKINAWISTWIDRINHMRTSQERIQVLTAKVAEFTTELLKETDKDKITVIENTIKRIKVRIINAKQQISNDLKQGRQSLVPIGENFEWGKDEITGTMEKTVESSTECQKVIQFIKDNWRYLEVFSELQEAISFDEERLCVELKHLKETVSSTPYDDLLKNKSYQAIFAIRSAIEYADAKSGKVKSTTTVEVADQYFSQEITSEKKQSSTLKIVHDAYIFNCDFAQPDEAHAKFVKTSAFAEKLERIVTMAFNRLNVLLNSQDESQINWNSLKFTDENHTQAEEQAPYSFIRLIFAFNNYFTQPNT